MFTFSRRALVREEGKKRSEDDILPVEIFPAEALDIEVEERGPGIHGEGASKGIDRNRGDPPLHRQVPEDDHQGRRNEDPKKRSVDDMQDGERCEVPREWDHQRDHSIDQCGADHDAPDPERGRQPCHSGGEHHLGSCRQRAQPGTFVEPETKGTAQVYETDPEQAAVEADHERTEQDGTDGKDRVVGFPPCAAEREDQLQNFAHDINGLPSRPKS